MASIVLHGGAAAVALLVLPRVMSGPVAPHQEEAPALVDINVVTPTELEARPQSAPVPRAPRRVVAPRRAPGVPATPQVTEASRLASIVPAPEPTPVLADEPVRPAAARFALSAGNIAGRSDSFVPADVAGKATELGSVGAPTVGERPLAESLVDVPARLATAAPLLYPEAARRAELEVDLPMELVVSSQGRVLSAFALAHPGYGLEEAALTAVRSYVFQPARRDGRQVAVKMRWTMQFRLH